MASSDDSMQQHARALSDPSRFRIFTHIADSGGGVPVADLTELLGFNHNAIRQHLAVLVEAGLVLEEREVRDRPGRPRLLYSVREDALRSFGDSSASYQRLLDVAMSGESPYDVGLRAASEQRANVGDVEAVVGLMRQLSMEGFEPTESGKKIILSNCPFADVASNGQSVVCELHRGLIDGHLGTSAELLVRDPHKAGCQIVLDRKRP